MYLYVIGSNNLDTITEVAKKLKHVVAEYSPKEAVQLMLFNTPAANLKIKEQTDIFRKHLSNNVIVSEILLDDSGYVHHAVYSKVFNNQDIKIVDLTTGLRKTVADLYFVASLIKVDKIYYLDFQDNKTYKEISPSDDFTELSRVSYFDLFYYENEIESLLQDSESLIVRNALSDLKSAIRSFFLGNSPRSVISDATVFVERMREAITNYLQQNSEAQNFMREWEITDRKGNKIGRINLGQNAAYSFGPINKFFEQYNISRRTHEDILGMITLPYSLNMLYSFRHLAAHSNMISYQFTQKDAQLVLITAIEVWRKIKECTAFWNFLQEH